MNCRIRLRRSVETSSIIANTIHILSEKAAKPFACAACAFGIMRMVLVAFCENYSQGYFGSLNRGLILVPKPVFSGQWHCGSWLPGKYEIVRQGTTYPYQDFTPSLGQSVCAARCFAERQSLARAVYPTLLNLCVAKFLLALILNSYTNEKRGWYVCAFVEVVQWKN